MPRAVGFEQYGGQRCCSWEVEPPSPAAARVLVRVEAAEINPGEAKIRSGALASRWPATFPSGQGDDLAGVVTEFGEDVTGFAAGDVVIGFTDNRASQPSSPSLMP
jgi:NADPH:quinone reductase-like Zn-dependent oxidoreductase